VRHVLIEARQKAATQAAMPEQFTDEKLAHQVATDLYRRVYLERNDGGRGLWHWFAGPLVAKKNEALQAAQLDGFEPNDHLEMTIEQIRASGVTIDLDGRVLAAYVEFLRFGELEPHDAIILLPEIIADLRRLLEIADQTGQAKLAEVLTEWYAAGECTWLCPDLVLKKKLYEHLFAPLADGKSRFQNAVARKNAELDAIVGAYLASLERVSQMLLATDHGGMSVENLIHALQPLNAAIDAVSDFPYEELFPAWAAEVIGNVKALRTFLENTIQMITEVIKTEIKGRIHAYLAELQAVIDSLKELVAGDLIQRIEDFKAQLKTRINDEKLAAVGLAGTGNVFDEFPNSVLYMNSFNSTVAVLANPHVAFNPQASGFFAGPTSFDASYQLTYNQLAVCPDLIDKFYPCGISVSEMLQPDYHRCQAQTASERLEPPIECHRGQLTSFADSPTPEDCQRTTAEQLLDPSTPLVGSISLAYPAELADPPPECFLAGKLDGLNSGFVTTEQVSDPQATKDRTHDQAGCNMTITSRSGRLLPWGLVALLVAFVRLRRRSH